VSGTRERWQEAQRRVGERAMRAAHRVMRERVEGGTPDGGLSVERLAALLEADPDDRRALEQCATAARAAVPEWGRADPDVGPLRAARAAREHEARTVIDLLMLSGALAGDGPSRVMVPGLWPSTWRALAVLREEGSGRDARRWACAVSAAPLHVVGLTHGAADSALAGAASRLHGLEAMRQGARHVLLTAGARLAHSLDRGEGPASTILRADCEAATRRIEGLDRRIAEAWARGQLGGV
jgi:hypothetical protein